jgi:hypothetical protein
MPLSPSAPPRARRARRRPDVCVEILEDRALPSGLSFQYVLDDPAHEFDAYPLLRPDLEAAGHILSGLLDGRGTIQVLVRADDAIPRSEGSTVGVVFVRSEGGMAVYQSAALAAARTGVNPNGSGPEVEIDLNAKSYLPHVWFDPGGAARTGTVPAGRTDFISLALHETLHALGFQGYRAVSGPVYGTFPGNYESDFDALSSFGSGADSGTLFFRGSHASAVYGGPVPLTSVGPSDPLSSQNFYHVGNPSGRPGTNLLPDVMNGMTFAYGTRYAVRPLDLAVLADLGWQLAGPAPAAPTPSVPTSAPATVRLTTPAPSPTLATPATPRRGKRLRRPSVTVAHHKPAHGAHKPSRPAPTEARAKEGGFR